MIDKNDVKMPVPKKDADLKDKGKVMQIEELLRLVNDADNKQELRLKQDYYSRFHWFGSNIGSDADKSYFSYQEEAVYDFVFNLNKSGILSDQVGMGKTIEAGMIISELASRNELRSLLIVVPNEILAQKWEYELAQKFGINGNPKVKALKNMDDFSRCVFDCVCNEKFVEYLDYKFEHKYDPAKDGDVEIEKLVAGWVKKDIATAVELINNGFDIWEMPGKPHVKFDGSFFTITGTDLKRSYKYDANGAISAHLRTLARVDAVNNARFIRRYREFLNIELESMFVVIGDYFKNIPTELSAVAQGMINNNPILVIPMSYSEYQGEKVILHEFLNYELPNKMKNYKHQYNVLKPDPKNPGKTKIEPDYEPYRIIDFFIDVGYQTLIVDEVHDYIDVEARMERTVYHNNNGRDQFPSAEYNRYELFDDYYFIKKKSLYKKLKNLADKASRKIFLTATPIKSDMVDFYLLTLLASNKDSEAYNQISDSLRVGAGAFATNDEIDKAINDIYNSFTQLVDFDSPEEFCKNSGRYLKEEKRDTTAVRDGNRAVRYIYPYFNNSFLRTHLNNANAVREYLNSHLLYMSVEEIVMELILAYNAEQKSDYGVSETIKKLIDLLNADVNDLQTRVVFRAILNNTLKLRFEEDFTKEDGEPIKRIRDLLMIKDGARKWHKTYRKYGIRHTRHQTYNLADCEDINKLNKGKMERYRNLPLWPRRDGKVIYLMRDDIFFDSFINVRRELPKKTKAMISMEDLPNVDKMTGDDDVKAERFQNAIKIFDYINNSMSGGDDVNHLPQFNKYDSVDIDDKSMVEYKLALVNYLMAGKDPTLGNIKNKVLLFAENNRDEIIEWFKYQKLRPLYKDGFPLDQAKMKQYEEKWSRYGVDTIGNEWQVSDNADGLETAIGNYLVIIDPKRYEKGVDLQKADTIINFDINYDPLKMEQRIGRIDRIRPKSKGAGDKKPKINIISFVPLNNMSGFVINFFAYELKMFTQWMGETTGIVSVPDDDAGSKSVKGQQVSFENKVYDLEKYYRHLYRLCGESLEDAEVTEIAQDFEKFFSLDKYKTKYDFEFLQELRPAFDRAFRNSISPQRSGYSVDRSDKKVMRFNSANGAFINCGAETCDKCPNKQTCNSDHNKKRNISSEFLGAVKDFLNQGEKFYERTAKAYADLLSRGVISSGDPNSKVAQAWIRRRGEEFKSEKAKVTKLLSVINDSNNCFTIPYAKYEEIFNPIKKLYWDEVAQDYIGRILSQFYKQCDSVLGSADLFENFIKVLSIADFMKNMEGNV